MIRISGFVIRIFLLASLPTLADDLKITGVQPASLDQPRIFMLLRRTPTAPPLSAKADKGLSALLGATDKDTPTFSIEAFLDTGASGIMLSHETATALGLQPATFQNQPITFEDVGVAGSEKFSVSDPLHASFSTYSGTAEGADPATYSKPTQPIRLQLRPPGGLLDMLTGGVDVAGMPAIHGNVVVIDPKPLNTFSDKLRTSLLSPSDKSIPRTTLHVPLTYVNFTKFTRTTPQGSPSPTLIANPMIGPNPLLPQPPGERTSPPPVPPGEGRGAGASITITPFSARPTSRPTGTGSRQLTIGNRQSAIGNPQSVLLTHNNHTASLTFLLDTGSAASLISTRAAAQLGIHYNPNHTKLADIPDNAQFSLPISGIGGNKTPAGTYLDSLSLPTREGRRITFEKAPVLIHDITVQDPKTAQTFTLDGVLGMNYLVASANVSAGLLPDLKDLTQGPFTTIVIDEPRATLGLTPAAE